MNLPELLMSSLGMGKAGNRTIPDSTTKPCLTSIWNINGTQHITITRNVDSSVTIHQLTDNSIDLFQVIAKEGEPLWEAMYQVLYDR